MIIFQYIHDWAWNLMFLMATKWVWWLLPIQLPFLLIVKIMMKRRDRKYMNADGSMKTYDQCVEEGIV
jgi:hypothetical protein